MRRRTQAVGNTTTGLARPAQRQSRPAAVEVTVPAVEGMAATVAAVSFRLARQRREEQEADRDE